jgi:hypothetical protein
MISKRVDTREVGRIRGWIVHMLGSKQEESGHPTRVVCTEPCMGPAQNSNRVDARHVWFAQNRAWDTHKTVREWTPERHAVGSVL